jgi:hypothetical protein
MKPVSFSFLIALAAASAAVTLRANVHPAPGVESDTRAISIPDLEAQRNASKLYPMPSVGSVAQEPPAYAHKDTLKDCLSYWDAGTHMSKPEWFAACQRTQNGTDPTAE